MSTNIVHGATAPRWLIGTVAACALFGCQPDAAVAPPATQADTRAAAIVAPNATPLSNRFAYALADQPGAPGYAPGFSYNATGGGIRITHSGPGSGYAVTFGGLNRAAGETENFIVTPYGTGRAHCVAGFYTISGSAITVRFRPDSLARYRQRSASLNSSSRAGLVLSPLQASPRLTVIR